MTHCTRTQEKIARGDALTPAEQAHLLDCPACGALAADFSLLEAGLDALAHDVPLGFAERVMARLAEESAAPRFIDRPWVALAFAYAGGVVALVNIARFLSSTLAASVGFGGTP